MKLCSLMIVLAASTLTVAACQSTSPTSSDPVRTFDGEWDGAVRGDASSEACRQSMPITARVMRGEMVAVVDAPDGQRIRVTAEIAADGQARDFDVSNGNLTSLALRFGGTEASGAYQQDECRGTIALERSRYLTPVL